MVDLSSPTEAGFNVSREKHVARHRRNDFSGVRPHRRIYVKTTLKRGAIADDLRPAGQKQTRYQVIFEILADN